MSNLGEMALSGRSYGLWPVKVLQIGARKWALQSCSGHFGSKIFTAAFFCAFFGQDKRIIRAIR